MIIDVLRTALKLGLLCLILVVVMVLFADAWLYERTGSCKATTLLCKVRDLPEGERAPRSHTGPFGKLIEALEGRDEP